MSRADTLRVLKACGAEGDRAKFTRLYVESRVSMAAANKAWTEGRAFARFIETRDRGATA